MPKMNWEKCACVSACSHADDRFGVVFATLPSSEETGYSWYVILDDDIGQIIDSGVDPTMEEAIENCEAVLLYQVF